MRSHNSLLFLCVTIVIAFKFNATPALSAEPAEPIKPIARRIPPGGNDIGDANREKIQKRLDEVTSKFQDLRTRPIASKKHALLIKQLAADVDVYLKAVRFALIHGEFYAKGDIEKSLRLLDTAEQRIQALEKSQHTWTTQRGKVVRGYYSDIDGSPQPYGLEIPEKLDLSSGKKVPLYVWLHGRGDKTTDMHFIAQREKGGCPISSFVDDGIIVHPFGRHCVGYKGPGEIDVLDVIQSVKERYNIDEDRVALLGFSMGGAGAWHIGAHYADQFCVVHAGAGFAETKEYIGLKKENYPAWYEQKLWGLYDVPNYTRNLFNTTVIAYSGENDKQIQAARVMERAFKKEGRTLQHIIGPGIGHKYHPDSIKEIMQVVKTAVKKGRDRWPKDVHLQTRTLRYHRMHWLGVDHIDAHWEDTRADATLVSPGKIVVHTKNVNGLSISWPWETYPTGEKSIQISIGNNQIQIPADEWTSKGHPQTLSFIKDANKWIRGSKRDEKLASKSTTHPGPIDDAFMWRGYREHPRPLLVVVPYKKSANAKLQRWIDFEVEHLKDRWRALYRGELVVTHDRAVTASDWTNRTLILFGDPASNAEIARVFEDERFSKMPIKWTKESITMGKYTYPAEHHVPAFIMPGIAPSGSYVVINSGITHREAHDRTNSLQNPKLPDWAIISLGKDPDAESAGDVKTAGFFDENWNVKANERQ